jgi:mono/diheme cytochrome c family protein
MRLAVFGLALAAASGSGRAADAARVTYHRDIVPIFQKHCQGCHRKGEAAPMPLISFKEARPWAKAIREAVVARRMPPWHADRADAYSNARVLSEAEIAVVRQWAESGAAEGNPKDAPPPVKFTDGWMISKPDLVIRMPTDAAVQADGQMEYLHFVAPTGFTEDRWIQEMEVRPGNRAVVHHIGVYLRPKGSTWMSEAKPGEAFVIKSRIGGRSPADELFAQYVTGGQAQVLPAGTARMIPAGADLIFQMHYQPNGKPAKDRSSIGLVFAKSPPTERVYTIGVADARFVIPPRDPAYRVNAAWRIHHDVRLLNVTPHVHLRGKSFECEVRRTADAGAENLVRVPRWDRNWQTTYELRRPLELRTGARLSCIAVFDNSANNPVNPDPNAEVRWGDQTTDEMMVAYMDVAFPASLPVDILFRRPGASK